MEIPIDDYEKRGENHLYPIQSLERTLRTNT
jgi:hypothetical protein